jgi:hypothetical protein
MTQLNKVFMNSISKLRALMISVLVTFFSLYSSACGKQDQNSTNSTSNHPQSLSKKTLAPLNETIEAFLASLRDFRDSQPPLLRTLHYPGTQPGFYIEGDVSKGEFFSGTPMKLLRDAIANGLVNDPSYSSQVTVALHFITRAKEIAYRMKLDESTVFEDDFITRIHKRNFENRLEDTQPSYE